MEPHKEEYNKNEVVLSEEELDLQEARVREAFNKGVFAGTVQERIRIASLIQGDQDYDKLWIETHHG